MAFEDSCDLPPVAPPDDFLDFYSLMHRCAKLPVGEEFALKYAVKPAKRQIKCTDEKRMDKDEPLHYENFKSLVSLGNEFVIYVDRLHPSSVRFTFDSVRALIVAK